MCVQNIEILLSQEVYWKYKGCAEQIRGHSTQSMAKLSGILERFVLTNADRQLQFAAGSELMLPKQRSSWSPVNTWLHRKNHNS